MFPCFSFTEGDSTFFGRNMVPHFMISTIFTKVKGQSEETDCLKGRLVFCTIIASEIHCLCSWQNIGNLQQKLFWNFSREIFFFNFLEFT